MGGARRGAGGVIAAIIIALLLSLAAGFYYWEQSYREKLDRLEAIIDARREMQAQVSLLVHMGVVGNSTGRNVSIVLYNGAPFPLTPVALVLVTVNGEVGVVNATHTPQFMEASPAILYRLTGRGLVPVAAYPSLQQAIARGATIPPGYLLEVNITASEEIDALRSTMGFKAPLARAGITALIPLVVHAAAVYADPLQATRGAV